MSPESYRGLRLVACLAACAFEWLPLRLLELAIGRRLYEGWALSCLYSGTVLLLCLFLLTPSEQQR